MAGGSSTSDGHLWCAARAMCTCTHAHWAAAASRLTLACRGRPYAQPRKRCRKRLALWVLRERERESVSEVTFASAELASVTIDSKYDVNHITIQGNLSSPLSSLDALCVVCECCACSGSLVLGPLGPCLVFTLLPPFTRTLRLTDTWSHSKYCDRVPACTASVLCVCALFGQGSRCTLCMCSRCPLLSQ